MATKKDNVVTNFMPKAAPKTQAELKVTKADMIDLVTQGLVEKLESDLAEALKVLEQAKANTTKVLQQICQDQADDFSKTLSKAGLNVPAEDITVAYQPNSNITKKSDYPHLFRYGVGLQNKSIYPFKVVSAGPYSQLDLFIAASTSVIKPYLDALKQQKEAEQTHNEINRSLTKANDRRSVKAQINARLIGNMSGGDELVNKLDGLVDMLHAQMGKNIKQIK